MSEFETVDGFAFACPTCSKAYHFRLDFVEEMPRVGQRGRTPFSGWLRKRRLINYHARLQKAAAEKTAKEQEQARIQEAIDEQRRRIEFRNAEPVKTNRINGFPLPTWTTVGLDTGYRVHINPDGSAVFLEGHPDSDLKSPISSEDGRKIDSCAARRELVFEGKNKFGYTLHDKNLLGWLRYWDLEDHLCGTEKAFGEL